MDEWTEVEAKILLVLCVIVIFCIVVYVINNFLNPTHYDVPVTEYSSGHRWSVRDLTLGKLCNMCNSRFIHGSLCDACGIWSHNHCCPAADKSLKCKQVSVPDVTTVRSHSLEHQWIIGNIPEDRYCQVCHRTFSYSVNLTDYRCCWCQRCVHADCMNALNAEFDWHTCDLGEFSDFIIPPNCIMLKKIRRKGRRHLVVDKVAQPSGITGHWCPLIVIGTKKSGNNDGAQILSSFRSVLNPPQVVDIDVLKPEHGLEWCHLLPEHECRILICGGDGTVGWVLSVIHKLQLQPVPPVAVLPLGTGNDLARVLGWGSHQNGDVDPADIMRRITAAQVVNLDRWKVNIVYSRHLGLRWPSKNFIMNNYASIGVDALVALNFHRQRQNQPHIFRYRFLNKLVYFFYGTKDCLERQCLNLHEKVSLELDGQLVELPELEGIVFLNIGSWAAGVNVWQVGENESTPRQRCDDGIIEVFGLYSSFHIAQLQVSMSEPYRIGQANTVKLRLKQTAPMQVDGEPWDQHPATISITHHSQAKMLRCTTSF